MEKLWEPFELGKLQLKNRLVMAPMTRSRAKENGTVNELAPEYYAQRASMGLLISEGTQPSPEGQGYPSTPGIYTNAQISSWKQVTQAVHDANGKLFIQLMHVGRMGHPDNIPTHQKAVAPSAIAPEEKIFTKKGMKDIPVPRALTVDQIEDTINAYRKSARAAIEAGADGVEIHGANGYLIHQFLGENSNKRHDEYGGSIQNRALFALKVAKAVVEEIGPQRVGFRISPMNMLGGVNEGENGAALYHYLVSELNKLNLVYLHMMHVGHEEVLADIRKTWKNSLIVNRAGRKMTDVSLDLDNENADLVSVGTWALANPDLVERLKIHAPLNEVDKATVYVNNGAVGYTDYPTLN
ncbi:NADH-dependent flavin oxidoreductase [Ligilactobacillus salitolerans]|uniref:NADH-dependent flavin oxidoreductase n=1 Tax=Ligilactobacillus salitolerans TaxID=1808352 RepID=A0A401IRX5_9LACO|nr:alkene reductase [Ligilactobacillus salitolerans]GBG94266.1 NADH-dependent flavin oxidoreductase [Ligilactobacillus salitolerans]